MFKDFDIKPFKKKKPPVNSGYTTRTEINELKKIPLKKAFVKKYDNIEAAFKKTAEEQGIKDYDKKIAAKLIKESAPVILELKKYHNRKRPYELDKKLSAFVNGCSSFWNSLFCICCRNAGVCGKRIKRQR